MQPLDINNGLINVNFCENLENFVCSLLAGRGAISPSQSQFISSSRHRQYMPIKPRERSTSAPNVCLNIVGGDSFEVSLCNALFNRL